MCCRLRRRVGDIGLPWLWILVSTTMDQTHVLTAFLLSVLFTLTTGEEGRASGWEKAEQKCEQIMRETDFDSKDINAMLEEIPRRAKCFVRCFFDEVGLTKGTEINHKLYLKWLNEELADVPNKDVIINSVRECVDGIAAKEKCAAAFGLYECFGKRYFYAKEVATIGRTKKI